MKELSIEEKAKLYDEAIKFAKIYHNQGDEDMKTMCETMFPELKESDDERMKNVAIRACKYMIDNFENSTKDYEDAIAWLEKQVSQDNAEDVDILHRFSFYSYKDEPNVLYLSGVYVNEECRNKGIGTKILEVADEVAKSLDCYAIRLKTKKDSDAERLYRTHAYNSLATEDKDEIWLEKQCEQKTVDEIAKEVCKNKASAMTFLKSAGIINEKGELAEQYRQSEQKTTDKVEPKFKAGDWVVCNNGPHHIFQVIERSWPNAKYRNINGTEIFLNVNTLEKQYHLWTIQDAKDGDVLVDKDNNIGIYKEIEGAYWDSYIYLGCDGKLRGFSIGGNHKQANTCPATKEQRDLLFQKIQEAGYEWDTEKKELKKINQKKTPIEGEFPYDNPSNSLESEIENIWRKLSSEGRFSATKDGFREVITHFVNYIKEQDDKELVELNPVWSEEDEKMIHGLIVICDEWEEAATKYAQDKYMPVQTSQAFKAGAKWQAEQMMAKAIEAVVSQVPCSNEIIFYNPSSVDRYYLPQEMNKLGLNKGDKVKLVIIKVD